MFFLCEYSEPDLNSTSSYSWFLGGSRVAAILVHSTGMPLLVWILLPLAVRGQNLVAP